MLSVLCNYLFTVEKKNEEDARLKKNKQEKTKSYSRCATSKNMIIFVYKNCEILENQGIKLQIAMTDGDLYRYSCNTHFDEMQLSKQILANICFLRKQSEMS